MASNTRPRTKALALGSSNRSTKLSALVSCLISRPAKPISRSNVNVASIKRVIEEQKIENLDVERRQLRDLQMNLYAGQSGVKNYTLTNANFVLISDE
ncbi:hypothetical protein PGB90_002070 [Kerria lacca]